MTLGAPKSETMDRKGVGARCNAKGNAKCDIRRSSIAKDPRGDAHIKNLVAMAYRLAGEQ